MEITEALQLESKIWNGFENGSKPRPQKVFSFNDGHYRFFTAQYGSWAADKRIVYRVQVEKDHFERAREKGITGFDRIFPASDDEIVAWKKDHPELQTVEKTS